MNVGGLTTVSRLLVWLATTVSSFLLGLLLVLFVPRAAEAVARTAVVRLGASIGFGFLMLVGVPIAAVIAIGVLLGIPLGVGVLLALGLHLLARLHRGRVRARPAVGRRRPGSRCSRSSPAGASCAGSRLIPVVAGLVWLAATVWGLGALVIAARAAGRPTTDAAGAGVVRRGRAAGAARPPIGPVMAPTPSHVTPHTIPVLRVRRLVPRRRPADRRCVRRRDRAVR